jgi:hypothetical protein
MVDGSRVPFFLGPLAQGRTLAVLARVMNSLSLRCVTAAPPWNCGSRLCVATGPVCTRGRYSHLRARCPSGRPDAVTPFHPQPRAAPAHSGKSRPDTPLVLHLEPLPLFRGNRFQRHAEQEESSASVQDNEVVGLCTVCIEERPGTIRIDRVASVRR